MTSNLKWLVIAKNEYRLQTSWIRGLRQAFPVVAVGLLAVWVFYLAPMLLQGAMTEFQGFIATQVALAVFELTLFSFSLFLVLMPISNTLRDGGMNRVELMLKAPVRPGDDQHAAHRLPGDGVPHHT
jgi:hypothetical protein